MEDIDYVIGNKYKKGIVNFIEDIENRTMDRLKNDNIFDEYEYTEYEFATLREMSEHTLRYKMDVIIFVHIVKYLLQEEEVGQEKKRIS